MAELLAEVEADRQGQIHAAYAEEESTLSEAQRVKDIIKDNERKVLEEARRRAEQEKRSRQEREQELARLRLEHQRHVAPLKRPT